VDVIRLGIWLLLLLMIFVPLEKLFAETPQRIFRKGLLSDLGYYFLNNLLPRPSWCPPGLPDGCERVGATPDCAGCDSSRCSQFAAVGASRGGAGGGGVRLLLGTSLDTPGSVSVAVSLGPSQR